MDRKIINKNYLSEEWEKLESPGAKQFRGCGWSNFRLYIICERGGDFCERCGGRFEFSKLHLHHILKNRLNRHLKFEPWNVMVVCQECHKFVESITDLALTGKSLYDLIDVV